MPVTLGKRSAVGAVPGGETELLIDKAQRSAITTEIQLESSVTAPVSKGQRLGTLVIKSGDQTLTQVPLVAEEGIERLSWGDVTVNLLRQMAMAKTS